MNNLNIGLLLLTEHVYDLLLRVLAKRLRSGKFALLSHAYAVGRDEYQTNKKHHDPQPPRPHEGVVAVDGVYKSKRTCFSFWYLLHDCLVAAHPHGKNCAGVGPHQSHFDGGLFLRQGGDVAAPHNHVVVDGCRA